LGDTKRVALRLKHWAGSLFSHGVREESQNIFVASPLVMPPFGPAWRRFITQRRLLAAVKRIARRMGITDPVLWTYLPTDTCVDLLRLLSTPRSFMTYYCVADFSHLTPHVRQLRQSEEATLRLSDLVLTTCSQLAEHCRNFNANVHIIPAVVDLDAFPLKENGTGDTTPGSAQLTSPNPASDRFLLSLPRPVMGYVGGLHRFVDYDLLIEMARARPHWSWVFVGAITTEIGELAKLSNVHLLGPRPHQELVHYIRRFDVCLIPYVNNPATATVVPVKLNEYLAVGKAVVSTELPTVCAFNSQHKVLITAASRPDSFLQAIEQALRLPTDEKTVLRRREVASLGESKTCLDAISELMEIKIREKASEET
jgi:glycosyltransferase involved in cell wall biosynthesis